MSARELAMVRTRRQLHTAAIGRARVRVRGWSLSAAGATAAPIGNVWLVIATAGVSVRVTVLVRPRRPREQLRALCVIDVSGHTHHAGGPGAVGAGRATGQQ